MPPLTEKEYFTRGCTALLDAVGGAIHHIGNIHKYARREDVPEKTMFIITTDGYENASRRYDYERVRRMIERQKEIFWTVLSMPSWSKRRAPGTATRANASDRVAKMSRTISRITRKSWTDWKGNS